MSLEIIRGECEAPDRGPELHGSKNSRKKSGL